MSQDLSRPELHGEVRFRVPLVFAIPLGAILLIAALAIGFSQVLLSVPADAATAIAIAMAANVLGACAVISLRPRLDRGSLTELLVVVLYPVIVGIAIAQWGLGVEEEAATAPKGPPPAAAPASEITAADLEWSTNTLTFAADKPIELPVTNEDTTVHNLSIYPTEDDAIAEQKVIFDGPDVDGGDNVTYEIDPLKPDTYSFICDYHTNMIGDFVVE